MKACGVKHQLINYFQSFAEELPERLNYHVGDEGQSLRLVTANEIVTLVIYVYSVTLCVCAVSYTHLTLPTRR